MKIKEIRTRGRPWCPLGSANVNLILSVPQVARRAFTSRPRILIRWLELINGTLSFYECRLSGGDTQRGWWHSNPTFCI